MYFFLYFSKYQVKVDVVSESMVLDFIIFIIVYFVVKDKYDLRYNVFGWNILQCVNIYIVLNLIMVFLKYNFLLLFMQLDLDWVLLLKNIVYKLEGIFEIIYVSNLDFFNIVKGIYNFQFYY